MSDQISQKEIDKKYLQKEGEELNFTSGVKSPKRERGSVTGLDLISDFTRHFKYAREVSLPNGKFRRESEREIFDRNMNMHIEKYPHLEKEIREAYEYVRRKEVLPSMRSLQFGGYAINGKSPEGKLIGKHARIYNCSYVPIWETEVFSEIMYLLLCGCGVGFSVQKHHVNKLPAIRTPGPKIEWVIPDTIEGWADSVKVLVDAYFYGGALPDFDYSAIRPKGAKLVTSGGTAPGPEPLKSTLSLMSRIFESKKPGEKLTSLECHDLVCMIADSVISGGIRRSSLLSLFSVDDELMLKCKTGQWMKTSPWRMNSNNSVSISRGENESEDAKERFFKIFETIKKGYGEPGFIFNDSEDWGFNPCGEAALAPYTFCNLTEIIMTAIKNQEHFEEVCRVAAFIGTLQAGYTDFRYLRKCWQEATEKSALLGVSQTGIVCGPQNLDLKRGAKIILKENSRVAKLIGVNKAHRTTLIKPGGTVTLFAKALSSGIHGVHSPKHIRRTVVTKAEPAYKFFSERAPSIVRDLVRSCTHYVAKREVYGEVKEFIIEKTSPEYKIISELMPEILSPHMPTAQSAVLEFPVVVPSELQKVPTRHESYIDFLERVRRYNLDWIRPGHRQGENYHNVSATLYLAMEVKDLETGEILIEDEWGPAAEYLWTNRADFSGIAVFPKDTSDVQYHQAPFEDVDDETIERLSSELHLVDMSELEEETVTINYHAAPACAGGACEVIEV